MSVTEMLKKNQMTVENCGNIAVIFSTKIEAILRISKSSVQ